MFLAVTEITWVSCDKKAAKILKDEKKNKQKKTNKQKTTLHLKK